MDVKKLTKKQLKAQQFRKSKEERGEEKDLKRKSDDVATDQKGTVDEHDEAPRKKRKTRRGKGGKGGKGSKGNRFLIFVGNLPRDVSSTELQAHFKSSAPDEIRIRPDKGIAFLEFDAEKDLKNIQSRMDVALLQHKTLVKGRKINVELTVGGGGNSKARLEKLKGKNEKFEVERRERTAHIIQENKRKKTAENGDEKRASGVETTVSGGVHPDRLKNFS
ncbi:LAMI_0H00320g1_1 [Lachancea mirantina]|uniref:LAMI_0H00320g1_1 n=1 Tax=Lachancea mirantina TaxID=1230905 RepID=A0A1G4KDJ7_9SACH|nr:LAMI_0H00320g1_1 [Lachancea mirantina]